MTVSEQKWYRKYTINEIYEIQPYSGTQHIRSEMLNPPFDWRQRHHYREYDNAENKIYVESEIFHY